MPVNVTDNFGGMLRYLRRRAHLTQRDLAQAVGYTEAHISRLENGERLPDLATVAVHFVSALRLKNDPASMERLLQLAAQSRDERTLAGVRINQVTIEHREETELGFLEDIPEPLTRRVERASLNQRVAAALAGEHCVVLCGLPGAGRTALAADVARAEKNRAVFWHTFIAGVNASADAITRQLALFLLEKGQDGTRPLLERRAEGAPMPLDQQLLILRAALSACPSLLCFDDAHHIASDETVLSIFRNLGAGPANLLLTSRENLPLPFLHIRLSGFEPGEARLLIGQMGIQLEPQTLERLLVKTDFNPMLLRLAAGQLLETRGGDAAGFIERLETKPQVASYLIRAVLNDLAPPAQWLAKLISVFRHPLDLHDEILNERIARLNLPWELKDASEQLQRRHLVDDTRHALLHPLIASHLYASLSSDAPLKRQLHRLAAEWAELGAGNAVEATHHWLRAGDVERAVEILDEQSESLFDQGQAQAAILVAEEALERVQRERGGDTLRRRLLNARGNLLRGTFRSTEAEASYREALSLAQKQPTIRAEIVRNLAQILLQRGQSDEALRLCRSAAADLPSEDLVQRARLGAIEARACLLQSNYEEAERVAAEACALAAQFAELMPRLADEVWARAERTLGWVNYTRHPQGAEALIHYRRALECARRAGLKAFENAVLSNIGTALMERGDLDPALESYHEALRGYEAQGDMYGAAIILHNLAALHDVREETDAALLCIEQAAEIERRIGDREGLLVTESGRATFLLRAGRLDEARRILELALIEASGTTNAWALGSCLCMLIETEILQGKYEEARAAAEKTLATPGVSENARIRAWATSGLALALLALDRLASARDLMAGAPPEGLGSEVVTRWQLTRLAVFAAGRETDEAARLASLLLDEARGQGKKGFAASLENFLQNPTPSIPELLRLALWQG